MLMKSPPTIAGVTIITQLLLLLLLLLQLLLTSNALECYVCCGCNGESSTACAAYGGAYNSYFATAINVGDIGKRTTCQLEPRFTNEATDNDRGDELLLASVTPACSQVIYYDTTFNEDLTLKMCMSLEACEAQKHLVGKSTHVYLGSDTAVYVDVLSVRCCTDEMCNNLSAPLPPAPQLPALLLEPPNVNQQLHHPRKQQPFPPPGPRPEPYMPAEPEPTSVPIISTTALPLQSAAGFRPNDFYDPIGRSRTGYYQQIPHQPVYMPESFMQQQFAAEHNPANLIRNTKKMQSSYADLVELALAKQVIPRFTNHHHHDLISRADDLEMSPARLLFPPQQNSFRFMPHITQRVVPRSHSAPASDGGTPNLYPELPEFADMMGITGPPPVAAAFQLPKVISAANSDQKSNKNFFFTILAFLTNLFTRM